MSREEGTAGRRPGRLGLLAVGLGIGAALAVTPGTAAADDMQISIDGIDLFPTAGNTATATSGIGDMAIAFGPNSNAVAEDGFGDFASADGTGSEALARGEFDTALATGTDSQVGSGLDNGVPGSFDFASAVGTNTYAEALEGNGNVVSTFDPFGTTAAYGFAGDGNDNYASVVGEQDDAFAGGTSANLLGNNDVADIFGNDSFAFAGANNISPGDFDLAAIFGDGLTSSTATGGDFLLDILP